MEGKLTERKSKKKKKGTKKKKKKRKFNLKLRKKKNQTLIYITFGSESNPETRKEQFGPSEGRNLL